MCSLQTSTGTRLMLLVVEKMGATAEDDELLLVFWRLVGGAVGEPPVLFAEDILILQLWLSSTGVDCAPPLKYVKCGASVVNFYPFSLIFFLLALTTVVIDVYLNTY